MPPALRWTPPGPYVIIQPDRPRAGSVGSAESLSAASLQRPHDSAEPQRSAAPKSKRQSPQSPSLAHVSSSRRREQAAAVNSKQPVPAARAWGPRSRPAIARRTFPPSIAPAERPPPTAHRPRLPPTARLFNTAAAEPRRRSSSAPPRTRPPAIQLGERRSAHPRALQPPRPPARPPVYSSSINHDREPPHAAARRCPCTARVPERLAEVCSTARRCAVLTFSDPRRRGRELPCCARPVSTRATRAAVRPPETPPCCTPPRKANTAMDIAWHDDAPKWKGGAPDGHGSPLLGSPLLAWPPFLQVMGNSACGAPALRRVAFFIYLLLHRSWMLIIARVWSCPAAPVA